jgi:hypothetical protein
MLHLNPASFQLIFPPRALLALGLSVIIHPSLLPRQVLIVLFTVLLLILILLFSLPRLARFLHPTFRVTTASSGAFSLVLAIALLSHIPAWADVWERLWLHDGESWGTPREKGLSAAFCIFLSVGSGIDWFLNKWLGECPDEVRYYLTSISFKFNQSTPQKWDNYLANYAANLPNDASRAGSFKPLTPNSLWHRLFHSPSKKDKDDILFPPSPLSLFKQPRGSISKDAAALLPNDDDDAYSKYPVSSKPDTLYDLPTLPSSPGFLKKARSQKMYKPSKKKRSKKGIPSTSGRKHIKFGVDLSSDSSESDSETGNFRPWMNQKPSLTSSSSTPTLVNGRESRAIDYELELAKLKKDRTKAGGDGGLDYSDYEEDLGSPRGSKERERHDAGWSPGFMKRHSNASTSTGGVSRNGAGKGVSNPNVTLPLGAVPATPSLIKALDRISAAQQDAFGIGGRSVSPARTHSPLRRTPVASVVKGKQKLDGMPQMEDLDSSDDEEGARRKEREQRAPRWEEFWRNVKAKADS